MKKHVYYVDGFSETYEKLSDLRNHLQFVSMKDLWSYDGCTVVRDGESYCTIEVVSFWFPRRRVMFKKLEDPLKGKLPAWRKTPD